MGLARICAGGAQQWASLPLTTAWGTDQATSAIRSKAKGTLILNGMVSSERYPR
jgi:hypothetical protein